MALIMQVVKKTALPQVEVSPVIEPVVGVPQKVLVQPGPTEVQVLTSEYLELWKKYDYFEVKAMVKRMEEIRKQLQTIANETMDEQKPAVFTCAQGEIEFSERRKVATCPNPLVLIQELIHKFGPEVATSCVDVALTPLRKVLSEFELQKHLKEEPGGRILQAVRPW